MWQDTVFLHLPKSESSLLGPPFGWLPSECVNESACPGEHFVLYKMTESLVVDGTYEDMIFDESAIVRVGHWVKACF
jgi:hypothetical protein